MIQKICLFTGAGIGSPLGLPTTVGFESTIKGINSELLLLLRSYLNNSKGIPDDIEKILYALEEFVKENGFINHILKTNTNNSSTYVDVQNGLAYYKQLSISAIRQIKSDLFDLLDKFDANDAFELYFSILSEIKGSFPDASISIFTTNYDLTFENAFDENDKLESIGIKKIEYGFANKRNKMVYDPSINFEWDHAILEYKKLHGSLDWNTDRNNHCVRSGIGQRPSNPEIMPLLYPGFKGIPTDDLFINLHDWLLERIGEAELLIVIGFAFRDQYINNIFDFSLRKNKKLEVLFYNPSEIDMFPPDSDVKTFLKKYTNFKHIKNKIEIGPNPLNLNKYIKS